MELLRPCLGCGLDSLYYGSNKGRKKIVDFKIAALFLMLVKLRQYFPYKHIAYFFSVSRSSFFPK
jgi:hypothetical protein